jgi:hypothetical protein
MRCYMSLRRDDKRPVALFDIDATVLNLHPDSNHQVLNEALLDAYLELGITDLYMFTNMDMKTLETEYTPGLELAMRRPDIIAALQAKGFRVHGVITPADVGYNKELGAAYTDLYLPQYERFKRGKLNEKTSLEDEEMLAAHASFKRGKNEAIRQLSALADTLSPTEQSPGTPYHADKSFNIKGILYKYTREKLPDWVGQVFYADDELSCTNTVKFVHDKLRTDKLVITEVPDYKTAFAKDNYEAMKDQYKINILKQLHGLDDKLIETKFLINKLGSAYKDAELQKGTVAGFRFHTPKCKHSDDIVKLHKEANKIIMRPDSDNVEKYRDLLILLQGNFYSLMNAWQNDDIKKRANAPISDYIAFLNSSDKHHHYAKLIGATYLHLLNQHDHFQQALTTNKEHGIALKHLPTLNLPDYKLDEFKNDSVRAAALHKTGD